MRKLNLGKWITLLFSIFALTLSQGAYAQEGSLNGTCNSAKALAILDVDGSAAYGAAGVQTGLFQFAAVINYAVDGCIDNNATSETGTANTAKHGIYPTGLRITHVQGAGASTANISDAHDLVVSGYFDGGATLHSSLLKNRSGADAWTLPCSGGKCTTPLGRLLSNIASPAQQTAENLAFTTNASDVFDGDVRWQMECVFASSECTYRPALDATIAGDGTLAATTFAAIKAAGNKAAGQLSFVTDVAVDSTHFGSGDKILFEVTLTAYYNGTAKLANDVAYSFAGQNNAVAY